MSTPRNLNDRFDLASDRKPYDRPVLSASSQKKPTVLAGLVAFADVILAVAANKFFEGTAWVIAVVAAGVAFVALTVVNVRAESGERIISWTRIHRIVKARIFVAIMSAALAGGGTYLVMNHLGTRGTAPAVPVPNAATSSLSVPSAATSSVPVPSAATSSVPVPGAVAPTAASRERAPSTTRAVADRCEATPGMIGIRRQAAAPATLTFCPPLLNKGAPLDGPFTAEGRVIGPVGLVGKLVIVNRADPDTCDANGNPPDPGYYYARGMSIDADGRWEFRDGLGYDEAVTIGRTYSFVTGPAEALEAIRSDREAHGSDGYSGMPALPAKAQVLATFYQAPGRYDGKPAPPCKSR